MAQDARVILLEFNELCPALMNRFISQGKLPGFERLRQQSDVWITDAEEQHVTLEPWIQWVTVHTGLSFQDHQVFYLNEAANCPAPRLWDLVSETGRTAWVCGSMNASYGENFHGFMLPDAWSNGAAARPSGEFDAYYHFLSTYVQEYTNDHVPLKSMDYLRFGAFMMTHGLTFDTAVAILRQLASERRAAVRWRRASLMDRLQWDVFCHYYKKLKPALSTFFLNSTAHLQHVYWRNMEPELFDLRPGEEEQGVYADAVEHGYRQMDALVTKCLALAGDEATIVLATGLSQQPCLLYEATGGKRLYRPRDMQLLLEFADLKDLQPAPVMAGQYHLRAADEARAEQAAKRLCSLTVEGKRLLHVEQKGRRVFIGCCVISDLPDNARLQSPDKNVPFFDVFYLTDITKSGMHHPDGILWMRRPDHQHQEHPERVSIRAIAPTVLDILGIPKPATLQASSLV
jgi:hypothetical protein